MLSNFEVDIIQLRTTPYKIGYNLGKYLKDKTLLTVFSNLTKPEINMNHLHDVFSWVSPNLLEELQGLSEGLQLPYKKVAAMFSGYDVPKLTNMGCSTFVDHQYYVRNYDFSPEIYDGLLLLLSSKNVLASCGYSLQVIGRHDGVNESGLAIGLHFVNNEEYQEGIAAWTSVRMVLDTCTCTEEAIDLLKEIPHAACYNFSLGDSYGSYAAVEVSPEKVLVRRESSFISCVNHFQNPDMKKKNRANIEGSLNRNEYIYSLKSQNLSMKEAFHKFSDKNSPLFFTDYDNLFGTLHTFAYSFEEKTLTTDVAQGNKDLTINFEEWVKGTNIKESKLNGHIQVFG
ncbi:peptidase C45 [Priestia aryabhattai]|uniref:C45 family autoproteolytic acyltransferase/hydolase n=1 Tax=Priestia flexa TaxID=86664 RepID=UPI000BA00EC1|nr:peptidase C45 [Priestia aryabhattai]